MGSGDGCRRKSVEMPLVIFDFCSFSSSFGRERERVDFRGIVLLITTSLWSSLWETQEIGLGVMYEISSEHKTCLNGCGLSLSYLCCRTGAI